MKELAQQRKSNFELMRIVSMFLIVLWHYILHSGIFYDVYGTTKLFLYFIYIIVAVHVNSFILVTGYFQYNKEFKLKKVLSLIGLTWFYKATYAILFFISGLIVISKTDLLFFLQPFNFTLKHGEFYWFINVYIFLYLLSPFLNKLILNLKQKEHKNLIIILFIMLSIVPCITLNSTLPNSGFSISSFVMFYIIGAYLNKYNIKDSYHFKNQSKKNYKIMIYISFIISCCLSFSAYIIGEYLLTYNNELLQYVGKIFRNNIVNYAAPFIVIESVLYLLFFETLDIQSKFINNISKLTFGVYLAHENLLLYSVMYNYLPIISITHSQSYNQIISMFIYSILIFILSLFVEFIRTKLFKLLKHIFKKFKRK